MGGNATDGCGHLMPSGEENTLEALTCSACNCHRNFHRKETQGETTFWNNRGNTGRKLTPQYPTTGNILVPSRAAHPHQMIMSTHNMMESFPSESDDNGHRFGTVAKAPHLMRKRFRTKFSQEQKEKMLDFAEKLGGEFRNKGNQLCNNSVKKWERKEESLRSGIWMRNNKHNLDKKNSTSTPIVQNPN